MFSIYCTYLGLLLVGHQLFLSSLEVTNGHVQKLGGAGIKGEGFLQNRACFDHITLGKVERKLSTSLT